MKNPQTNLPPGFRFHPTDEELILHYLRKRVSSTPLPVSIIAEVDIYKFDPWDLPGFAFYNLTTFFFFQALSIVLKLFWFGLNLVES